MKTIKHIATLLLLAASARAADFYVSPDGSYTSIQDAVDAASDGDTVYVAAGTYDSGSATGDGCSLASRVCISKEITVISEDGPESTIIDAGGTMRGVYLSDGATLSGFTVTNGGTWTDGGTWYYDHGGGGVWLGDGTVVTNCVISGNSAATGGGAFFYEGGTICNSRLIGNSADNEGGAARGHWGGQLINCLITGNIADEGGGLKDCAATGCTISGNTADDGGGMHYGHATNSIIYYNSAESGSDLYYVTPMRSCSSDATAGENNNLTDAPCFTDADNGDYTLLASSPCINAGNNSYASGATDLAGNSRIQDGTVDLGAYEYSTLSLTTTDSTVSCYATDIDISGTSSSSSGTLRWTNETTGLSGTGSLTDTSWTLTGVTLTTGQNTITITLDGTSASVSVEITRAATPVVAILTEAQTVDYETDSICLSGTNCLSIVGSLSWTNAATTASGTIDAETTADTEWTISGIALEFGANELTVSGTNSLGDVVSDTVTITRGLYHSGDSPVHYVSPDGSGTWPYTNWTTAATSIQDAVDAAMADDTVLVTNGTYATGWTITPGYSLTNRLCVTNSITVQSVNGPESTLIDAGGVMRGAYLSGGATLSGFTVTNGITWTSGGTWYVDRSGGGVWLGENTVVSNCVISGNNAATGGGVFCCGDGELYDCRIAQNTCDNEGGGVRCYNGGTLYGCTITGNVSSGDEQDGGGCYEATLTNCVISSNSAHCGGGCCDGTQTGCTITGNTADLGGGCCRGTQTGCTISGNTGGGCLGGTQTNCIVYLNIDKEGDVYNWYHYTPGMSYCCSTPLPDGTGNISDDPCFTDAVNGDYTLLASSPCIDAGTNSTQMVDIEGNDRCVDGDFNGDAVTDIGAYEYQPDQTDSDGDAFTDYEEYVADTSMTNAADYFSVDIDGDSLSFTAAAGRSYAVQVCTNLVEGSWNTCTNLSGTGSTEELLTDPDEEKPEAFYRVQVELSE